MLTLALYGLLAVLVAAALFLLAAYLLPAGEQIAPPIRDEPLWELPASKRLDSGDVSAVRLPVALRGYRFAETDLLLDRLADELRARDEEIARLRVQLGGDDEGAETWMPSHAAERPGTERSRRGTRRATARRTRRPSVRRRSPTRQVRGTRRSRRRRSAMSADRPRCAWATSAPEYVAYHDDEWGTPLHGERALFERLSLEAFQSGLSWLIILRKRPRLPLRVRRLRRRRGRGLRRRRRRPGCWPTRASSATAPRSTPTIAQRPGDPRRRVPEGLDELLWSFAPAGRAPVRRRWPTSRRRRRSRWRWPRSSSGAGSGSSGPTTAYALMQATGMVDDHVATCWRARS